MFKMIDSTTIQMFHVFLKYLNCSFEPHCTYQGFGSHALTLGSYTVDIVHRLV